MQIQLLTEFVMSVGEYDKTWWINAAWTGFFPSLFNNAISGIVLTFSLITQQLPITHKSLWRGEDGWERPKGVDPVFIYFS